MADAKVLEAVKKSRRETGTFKELDDALMADIDEVIGLMVDAGVPEKVANSEASAGVIARGIEDIKHNGGKLSPYFYQRVTQLAFAPKEETGDVQT